MLSHACCLFALLFSSALTVTAAEPPPAWAYGFKETVAPAPAKAAPGRGSPPPADPAKYGLSGTDRKFTRAEITAIYGPADFYPEDHPTPPPDIVARGKEPLAWA